MIGKRLAPVLGVLPALGGDDVGGGTGGGVVGGQSMGGRLAKARWEGGSNRQAGEDGQWAVLRGGGGANGRGGGLGHYGMGGGLGEAV